MIETDSRSQARGSTVFIAVFIALISTVPATLVLRGFPLSIRPSTVVALLIGIVWVCLQCTNTLGVAKGPNGVRSSIFAFLLVCLLSWGYAGIIGRPSDELAAADRTLILLASYCAVALIVVDGIKSIYALNLVIKISVVGGTFLAFTGVIQFLTKSDVSSWINLPFLRTIGDVGIGNVGETADRADFTRAAGITAHPIELGIICTMLLPLSIYLVIQCYQNGPRYHWWVVTSILLATAAILSVSRSAVIGLVVGIAVACFGWPQRWKLIGALSLPMLAVCLYVAIPGLLGTIYDLFSTASSDTSIVYRQIDYPFALQQLSQNLWLGHGVGTWYTPKYSIFDNQYIRSSVEGGLLGLAVFLGVLTVPGVSLLRALWSELDPGPRNLGVSLLASVSVAAVGAATFDLLSFSSASAFTFLAIGMAGAFRRLTGTGQRLTAKNSEMPATRGQNE